VPSSYLTPAGGLSRKALALAPSVRITTAIVFIVGGLVALPAAWLLDLPATRMLPFLVFNVTVGIAVWFLPPPPIGHWTNHLLLFAAYLSPALAYYLVLPAGAAVLPGFVFVGALVAFRLMERREIAAHLLVITLILLIPVPLGLTDSITDVGLMLLAPGLLGLAAIVTTVLEAAEVQGTQLEKLIRRDPLTGAGNRRLLNERTAYELARHNRSGRPLSLITLDLDGFKAVNDELGHASGDEVLTAVAKALTASVRQQDTVVRQGGDEFCVLLPETTFDDAARLAAKLRLAIAAISPEGHEISAAWGIVEHPRDGLDIETLLTLADERLRGDKRRRQLHR
jgi:diguanylate cyclase (GGDEF)-like protein